MGQVFTGVPCPECGASGESPDPGLSRWQCTTCGSGYFLRRCSACARVAFVDGLQGFRQPWPCTWCGQFNTGFSQNRDPAAASAAELAAEVARYGLARTAERPGADGQAPGAPLPGQAGPAPRSGLRTRRAALAAAVAVAVAGIAACVLAAAAGPGTAKRPAGPAGQGGTTRAVRVTAGSVGMVDLQGVPGQLSIAGAGTGQVMLTGQLRWTGSAPVVETRLDHRAGVLVVSVRCAPASPCTEDLRLTVPADTAAVVRQPAGRIVVAGLAGPLRITAENADISASGLRSPDLAAVITSGHLSATFTAPPRRVDIMLAFAQATLRLPSRAAYRVTRQVTSGHISVAVPQASAATSTVTARLRSGELELLPS